MAIEIILKYWVEAFINVNMSSVRNGGYDPQIHTNEVVYRFGCVVVYLG